MKKFNGCVVKNGVIELTKAFAKQAYTPGTAEFRHLAELHKAFPDFPIVQRTATKNENKEKHDGLTVARMEFLIKNYLGDEIVLAEFKEVQKFYNCLPARSSRRNGKLCQRHRRDVLTDTKREEVVRTSSLLYSLVKRCINLYDLIDQRLLRTSPLRIAFASSQF